MKLFNKILGKWERWNSINGSANTYDATKRAGERNTSSSLVDYTSVHEEWTYTVVSLADNSTTVYAAPALLGGIFVNTIPTTTTLIKDDTTTILTLPAASLTANSPKDLGVTGIRCETSLVIDPDDAETITDFVVMWRPL